MKPYYDDGKGIVIYHGDAKDIVPSLTFGAIVSDPPYGMAYKHGTRKGGVRMGHDDIGIIGDDLPFDPSLLLGAGVPTILWGGNHFADKLPASRGWLVWDKRQGRPSNDQSDCELAWTNILTTARTYSAYWSGGVRLGREQREGRYHVNQKPVALMIWCLDTLPTEIVVLDPFMGSGSTLVAAKETGRKAIGIEIEEKYCEIAVRRLAQEVLL